MSTKNVCMYVCMHACMHICMYVRICVCVYVCMLACACVCMYEHTYIQEHESWRCLSGENLTLRESVKTYVDSSL